MFPVEISHITLKNLFWGQPWFHRPLLPTQWIILSEVSIISMGIIFHQSRGYMILRGSDSTLTSSDARHKVSSLPDIKSTGSNMSLQLHHYYQVTFIAIKSLLLNECSPLLVWKEPQIIGKDSRNSSFKQYFCILVIYHYLS